MALIESYEAQYTPSTPLRTRMSLRHRAAMSVRIKGSDAACADPSKVGVCCALARPSRPQQCVAACAMLSFNALGPIAVYNFSSHPPRRLRYRELIRGINQKLDSLSEFQNQGVSASDGAIRLSHLRHDQHSGPHALAVRAPAPIQTPH
jgi:hypothetical protein